MIEKFGFNNKYITRNGIPWFPVMGEFHYSRFPAHQWLDALYKMKAGGVTVVSSYVIWIHHEEEEGKYDFAGNKDLRQFVEACNVAGVYMFLRIGPWCHGEVRNGGFPDWILQKKFVPRTNDEGYFQQVKTFYTKIFEQVNGLLLKDDGPIIGVQIENEYGHCGGLTGEEGEAHMIRLTQMAREIGFDVPFYTATGWGGAVTGGLLPVMGGYCEAPWDQRLTDIEPSGNYIFTYERNDHNIGSDFALGTGITFDVAKFPFLTAELGGGLQVTQHRRPVARGKDIGAMSLVKLGSGCNLLGYYMYHGGTNPQGKLSTLQESRATGYLNDLPVLSYDFRAPIREYGQWSASFHEIKLLAMFVKDFGADICAMETFIPEENPLYPQDTTLLRSAVRHNGAWGFLFANNYQRRKEMAAHKNVVFSANINGTTYVLPPMDIDNGDFSFFPLNMPTGNGKTITAPVTPLCSLNGQPIFYGKDMDAPLLRQQYPHVMILTRTEALNSYKVTVTQQEHLVVTDGIITEEEHGVMLYHYGDDANLKTYPPLVEDQWGFDHMGQDENGFGMYQKKMSVVAPLVQYRLLEAGVFEIEIEYGDHFNKEKVYDFFLDIVYGGESAKLFVDGAFVADDFYTGESWQVGLGRFGFPNKLRMEILPLYENTPVFLEKWPSMNDGVACMLEAVDARLMYKTKVL